MHCAASHDAQPDLVPWFLVILTLGCSGLNSRLDTGTEQIHIHWQIYSTFVVLCLHHGYYKQSNSELGVCQHYFLDTIFHTRFTTWRSWKGSCWLCVGLWYEIWDHRERPWEIWKSFLVEGMKLHCMSSFIGVWRKGYLFSGPLCEFCSVGSLVRLLIGSRWLGEFRELTDRL